MVRSVSSISMWSGEVWVSERQRDSDSRKASSACLRSVISQGVFDHLDYIAFRVSNGKAMDLDVLAVAMPVHMHMFDYRGSFVRSISWRGQGWSASSHG